MMTILGYVVGYVILTSIWVIVQEDLEARYGNDTAKITMAVIRLICLIPIGLLDLYAFYLFGNKQYNILIFIAAAVLTFLWVIWNISSNK